MRSYIGPLTKIISCIETVVYREMNGNIYDDVNRLINNGLSNGNNGIINIGNGLNGVNGNDRISCNDRFNNDNGLNGRRRILNGNGLNGNAVNGVNGVNGKGLLNGILNGVNGVNGVNGTNGNGLLNGVNGNGLNGVNGVNGNGLLNGILNGVNGVNGNGLNGVNGRRNRVLNGNGVNGGNGLLNGNDEVTILPFPRDVDEDVVRDGDAEFTGIPKSFKQVLKKGKKLFVLDVPGNVTDIQINGTIYYKTRCSNNNNGLGIVPARVVLHYSIKDSEGNVIRQGSRNRDVLIASGDANNDIQIAELYSLNGDGDDKTIEFGILSVKDKNTGAELLNRKNNYIVGNAYAYVE